MKLGLDMQNIPSHLMADILIIWTGLPHQMITGFFYDKGANLALEQTVSEPCDLSDYLTVMR